MPFAGSLAWRLKRELSGFLGLTGNVSTTLSATRNVAGSLNVSGSVSTRTFYYRTLTGSVSFSGTNDPAFVQLANVSGSLPAMNGTVSATLSKGTAVFRRTLEKLGMNI